ncbi:MAG TPA: PPK2 family polyphosphate kinase [Flavisolibacter sp.]|jgi:PPK2 family polyphosphate:nucleotide phosphotransferase|nr:PPK2 family polyphosphate kinase [Flavisolibacter sp.]
MAILQTLSTRAPVEFDKKETKALTQALKEQLDTLQNLLYAESKHAILIIIQGMDASGKDGAIRNVLSGLNPQGIFVKSFKVPTAEELSHDFLWRIHQHTPAKGMIQVFNRSHYEDVLVPRVKGWCDVETAKKRFGAINDFERLLEEHNNTKVLKFYLHISPEEQQERLNERIHNPLKSWKYNANDFAEAKLWDDYMKTYEDVFEHCNEVPWIIVPADQNWYKEYLITKTLVDTLAGLRMNYPKLEEKAG